MITAEIFEEAGLQPPMLPAILSIYEDITSDDQAKETSKTVPTPFKDSTKETRVLPRSQKSDAKDWRVLFDQQGL